jgi:hypothetical protein
MGLNHFGAGTQKVRVARNARGYRLGAGHHRAKYPDEVISQARTLREQGRTYAQIAAAVGAPWRTVADWVNFATRYA